MKFQDISAVVFDAVGTVIYPSPPVAVAYQNAIQRHFGVEIDENLVKESVDRALRARAENPDLTTSEHAEREFWGSLIRQLCPQTKNFEDCFDDLFAHFADANSWRCYDDTQPLLDRLHQQQIVTGIASNFDQRLNSVCDGLTELKTLSHRIISSEIGWRKPATRFFQAVTETLELSPHRILFVGDGIENDVRGALAAGMHAVWVCRTDSSEPTPAGALKISSLAEIDVAVSRQSDSPE